MVNTGFLEVYWISPARNALSTISDQELHNHAIFEYASKLINESSRPPLIPVKNLDQAFGENKDGTPWTKIGKGGLLPDIYLPVVYIACVFAEAAKEKPQLTADHLGSLSLLHAYLMRRWEMSDEVLPQLPLDEHSQRMFTRWARKEIDFTTSPQLAPRLRL